MNIVQSAPTALRPFLTAKGSLTARLETLASQPLMVKICHQRHRLLTTDEKRQLRLPCHRPVLAWERQVELFGGSDGAWVLATSVFPLTSLVGDGKRLRHLGRTPIGYVLFKRHRTLPHRRYYFKEKQHYGRSTIYDWQGRPLLIKEVFLGEFERVLMKGY